MEVPHLGPGKIIYFHYFLQIQVKGLESKGHKFHYFHRWKAIVLEDYKYSGHWQADPGQDRAPEISRTTLDDALRFVLTPPPPTNPRIKTQIHRRNFYVSVIN